MIDDAWSDLLGPDNASRNGQSAASDCAWRHPRVQAGAAATASSVEPDLIERGAGITFAQEAGHRSKHKTFLVLPP
jgi:hypothetical protein